MNKVIIMVGIPCSGKTTCVREYIRNNPKTIRVSADDIRQMLLLDSEYSEEKEKMAGSIRDETILYVLDRQYDVVVDDININKNHITHLTNTVHEYRGEVNVETKDLTDVPLDVCLERNRNRPNPVPEEVIRRMHDKLKAQKKNNLGYE